MILSNLDKLVVADGRHLQEICGLGGVRNTNRILHRLESDGYLRSFKRPQKVYALSKRGRELIGSDRKVNGRYVDHALLRNDAYLALDMPKDWRVEESVKFRSRTGKKRFTPDATCTYNNRLTFVEIDRTQRMSENRKKFALYAEVQQVFRSSRKQPPVVRYYTISGVRAERLRKIAKDYDAHIIVETN